MNMYDAVIFFLNINKSSGGDVYIPYPITVDISSTNKCLEIHSAIGSLKWVYTL